MISSEVMDGYLASLTSCEPTPGGGAVAAIDTA
ncbi:cyclodeaminase/cyclohydrolase family protein [Cryobacterium serini]|nr:cyclodeaminase/cyclohydrolase family protein [Cryobacterium serini]